MLKPYRRHLATCPFASKGQNYTLCDCPIWVDGSLDGKRYRKSLGTTDWATACQRVKMLTNGTIDVTEDDKRRLKLGTAIKLFMADAQARNLRASTLKGYGYSFAPMVSFFGESAALASLTTEVLKRFRATRKIQPSSNFRELVQIKTFFKWAVEAKHLLANPAERSKLKLPKVEYPPTLPFTPQETAAMLAACDKITARATEDTAYIRKRARALLLLLMYSGLRIGDASYLRREAMDASGYLTLRVMKTGVPLKVKLHADAVEALTKLPALNPAYFFWDGKSLQHDTSMRYLFGRIGALAGVGNAHPHRCRDTFACELLLAGTEIRTVQMLLGHASVRTTEDHYGHFVASHQALLDGATATLNFTRQESAAPVRIHTVKRRLRNA